MLFHLFGIFAFHLGACALKHRFQLLPRIRLLPLQLFPLLVHFRTFLLPSLRHTLLKLPLHCFLPRQALQVVFALQGRMAFRQVCQLLPLDGVLPVHFVKLLLHFGQPLLKKVIFLLQFLPGLDTACGFRHIFLV